MAYTMHLIDGCCAWLLCMASYSSIVRTVHSLSSSWSSSFFSGPRRGAVESCAVEASVDMLPTALQADDRAAMRV